MLLSSKEGLSRVILVTGKGGVGKTTFSALLSLAIAPYEKDVRVVSIDPSHHLGDVLETELSHEERKILDNLRAAELNMDILVENYLRKESEFLKRTYKATSALNLEKFFDVLKYAPGIEEEAVAEHLFSYFKEDVVTIVDTPPTGPTLRILSFPWIQEMWLQKLIELRAKIVGLKESIDSIKMGKKVEIDDKILYELLKMREEVSTKINLLRDSKEFGVFVVTIPERLPLLDMERLIVELKKKMVKIIGIVLNKYNESRDRDVLERIRSQYQGIPIVLIPSHDSSNIIGKERLLHLLREVKVIE
ncbi:MAG: ArsA family ATPase [Fervidicoccaceae archaeon]